VPGVFLVPFNTFGVRLVNATRSLNLNLLIQSTYVSPENKNGPRGNYPNQQTVFNIAPGSYDTTYLPLNISLDSIAGYWFSTSTNAKDTVASTVDNAHANLRYSKIAVEEDSLNAPSGTRISFLSLPDTMNNPAGNLGRVRLINLSPDHPSVDVTINGGTVTLKFKEMKFYDVAPGSSITVKDGVDSKTYSIPVSVIRPISIYLLPEQTKTAAFPIEISSD
jgi:hypothetical protein